MGANSKGIIPLGPGETPKRKTILLQFAKDDDVLKEDNPFEKIKNRERTILIGNCRLGDVKAEKPGTYEITAPVVSIFSNLFYFLGN
jgi:hypothetical protein